MCGRLWAAKFFPDVALVQCVRVVFACGGDGRQNSIHEVDARCDDVHDIEPGFCQVTILDFFSQVDY